MFCFIMRVEFSESYVSYIEEQVDSILFEIKDAGGQTETELIDSLITSGHLEKISFICWIG